MHILEFYRWGNEKDHTPRWERTTKQGLSQGTKETKGKERNDIKNAPHRVILCFYTYLSIRGNLITVFDEATSVKVK